LVSGGFKELSLVICHCQAKKNSLYFPLGNFALGNFAWHEKPKNALFFSFSYALDKKLLMGVPIIPLGEQPCSWLYHENSHQDTRTRRKNRR
jgi:hypothetical protein